MKLIKQFLLQVIVFSLIPNGVIAQYNLESQIIYNHENRADPGMKLINTLTDEENFTYQLMEARDCGLLVKLDPLGNQIWATKLPSYNGSRTMPLDLKFTDNFSIAIVSNNNYATWSVPLTSRDLNIENIPFSHGFEIYSVKTNSGHLNSHHFFQSYAYTTARDFEFTDGKIMVLGDASPSAGTQHMALFEFANDGSFITDHFFPLSPNRNFKYATHLKKDGAGRLYFAGFDSYISIDDLRFNLPEGGWQPRAFYGRFTSSGNIEWVQQLDSTSFTTDYTITPQNLIVTNDYVYLIGTAQMILPSDFTSPTINQKIAIIRDAQGTTRSMESQFHFEIPGSHQITVPGSAVEGDHIYILVNNFSSVSGQFTSFFATFLANMTSTLPEAEDFLSPTPSIIPTSVLSRDLLVTGQYVYIATSETNIGSAYMARERIRAKYVEPGFSTAYDVILPSVAHENYVDNLLLDSEKNLLVSSIEGSWASNNDSFNLKVSILYPDLALINQTSTVQQPNCENKVLKSLKVNESLYTLSVDYCPYTDPARVVYLSRYTSEGALLWRSQVTHSNPIDLLNIVDGDILVLCSNRLYRYDEGGFLISDLNLDTLNFMGANFHCFYYNSSLMEVFIGGHAIVDADDQAVVCKVNNLNQIIAQHTLNEIDHEVVKIIAYASGHYTTLVAQRNQPSGVLRAKYYSYFGNLLFNTVISNRAIYDFETIHLRHKHAGGYNRIVVVYMDGVATGVSFPYGQTRLAVLTEVGTFLFHQNVSRLYQTYSAVYDVEFSGINGNLLMMVGTEYDNYNFDRNAAYYSCNIVSSYEGVPRIWGYGNGFNDEYRSIGGNMDFTTHFLVGSTQAQLSNRNYRQDIGLINECDAIMYLQNTHLLSDPNYLNLKLQTVESINDNFYVFGNSGQTNNSDEILYKYVNLSRSPIQGSENKITFNVYPNPTQSTFTLESVKSGNLKIVGMDGKQIANYSLVKGANTFSINAESGVYWLVASFEDEMIETTKLVIVK